MRTTLYAAFSPADADTAENDPRTRIALTILNVAGAYTGRHDVLDSLADRDEGLPLAVAVEQAIRHLADDAEGVTLGGSIISGTLADAYLLDDYLRIRAVEQHYAFDDDLTDAEETNASDRLLERAEAAAQAARTRARRRLEGLALCLCGENYDRHLRNQAREWGPADPGVCFRYQPVNAVAVRGLNATLREAGWRAWLGSHGYDLSEPRVAEGAAVLRALRTQDNTGTLLAGDAYAAAAVAIGL